MHLDNDINSPVRGRLYMSASLFVVSNAALLNAIEINFWWLLCVSDEYRLEQYIIR